MSGRVSGHHSGREKDGKTIAQTHAMITIIVEADSMFQDFNISNLTGSVYNAISRERVL